MRAGAEEEGEVAVPDLPNTVFALIVANMPPTGVERLVLNKPVPSAELP